MVTRSKTRCLFQMCREIGNSFRSFPQPICPMQDTAKTHSDATSIATELPLSYNLGTEGGFYYLIGWQIKGPLAYSNVKVGNLLKNKSLSEHPSN